MRLHNTVHSFALIMGLLASIFSCSADTTQPLVGSEIDDGVWPAWSPDGQWLLYCRELDLWRSPVDGGREELMTNLEGRVYQGSYDPSDHDGRIVFVNNNSGHFSLIVQDLSLYQSTTIFESSNVLTWPCFTKDGKNILFLQFGKPGIQVIDSGGGTPETISNQAGWQTSINCIQLSADSDRIIYVNERAKNSFTVESIPVSGGVSETIITREEDESYFYCIFYAIESPGGDDIIYYESIGEKGMVSTGAGPLPGITKDKLVLSVFNRTTQTSTMVRETFAKNDTVGLYFQSKFFSSRKSSLELSANISPDGKYLAYSWITNVYQKAEEGGNVHLDKSLFIEEL